MNADLLLPTGLTWPRANADGLSLRVAVPQDCVFADKGPAAFVPGDGRDRAPRPCWRSRTALHSLSLCRFSLARAELASSPTRLDVVQRTPVPDLTPADEAALAALARRAWSLKRSLDTRTETSHAFVLPALLQVPGDTLAARAAAWADRVRNAEAELAAIQAEIDERCFALYGIDDEDRRAITEGFGGQRGRPPMMRQATAATIRSELPPTRTRPRPTTPTDPTRARPRRRARLLGGRRRLRPLRRPPRHR